MRRALLLVVALSVVTVAVSPAAGVDVPIQAPDDPALYSASDGPSVKVQGNHTVNFTSLQPDTNTINISTTNNGTTVFSSPQPTDATVRADELTGAWTNVTGLNVDQADLTINPDDNAPVVVGGNVETLSYRGARQLDDGVVDFAYSGPSGTSLVTLQGVPANTPIQAVDTQSGATLDVATSDGSGEITFDELDNSDHNVQLQEVDPSAPIIDGASADPDSETVRWRNETLSVGVSDQDFAETSDEVTVEFTLNGSVVGTDTLTSNGTASLQVGGLDEGQQDWSVTATDSFGETTSSSTFSFTVDHYDAQLSDPNPESLISYEPTEVNVSISDADFGNDGDQLDVYFELDGSDVGTDTLTSNGTASASIGGLEGGEHNWSVAVQDQYGQWTNQSYTFSVPSKLFVYQEAKPTKLVDNVTTDLRFYFEDDGGIDTIVTRNTSNAKLNLTGLPIGQPFVAVADADGYLPRRIFVPSLYETQSVYLLNDSMTHADVVFEIEDYTGDFPKETSALFIQRSLNGSYQTVLGDYFGASGQFPAQLRYNTRHKLIILNTETGQRRELGTFTPLQSSEQTVTVTPNGEVTVKGPGAQVNIQPSTRTLAGTSNQNLSVTIDGGQNATLDTWSVDVYYVNESADTKTSLFSESSSSGGNTKLTTTLNLSDRGGGSVKVVANWTTEDGRSGGEKTTYSVQNVYENENSLLSGLAALVGLIAGKNQDVFQISLGVIGTILITAAVSSQLRLPSEVIGLVAVGSLTGFAIVGMLPYSIMFVAVAVWGGLAFLRRGY